MKCPNHPRNEADHRCARCGAELCGSCVTELAGKRWCTPCLEAIVAAAGAVPARATHPSSGLVAALLSILPGAGHMYLGLLGKGFALMGLLIASVFLVVVYSDATGMYWLTAYLVPTISVLLLSYAVFDSLAVAEALRAGRAAPKDATMELISERVLFNRRTGGWALVLAGALGLLHFVERAVGPSIDLVGPLAALAVPLILVAIGIRLLVKGRSR